MDMAFVEHFANNWIDDWNSHDLSRILAHYNDDFEMLSPSIHNSDGEYEVTGTLRVNRTRQVI
jgi:ketosteroid isomerase-like protein